MLFQCSIHFALELLLTDPLLDFLLRVPTAEMTVALVPVAEVVRLTTPAGAVDPWRSPCCCNPIG